jgi:hypothetical protein
VNGTAIRNTSRYESIRDATAYGWLAKLFASCGGSVPAERARCIAAQSAPSLAQLSVLAGRPSLDSSQARRSAGPPTTSANVPWPTRGGTVVRARDIRSDQGGSETGGIDDAIIGVCDRQALSEGLWSAAVGGATVPVRTQALLDAGKHENRGRLPHARPVP